MISFTPGPAEAVPFGRYCALQEPDHSHRTSRQTGWADAAGELRQLCTAEISGSVVQAAVSRTSVKQGTRTKKRQVARITASYLCPIPRGAQHSAGCVSTPASGYLLWTLLGSTV